MKKRSELKEFMMLLTLKLEEVVGRYKLKRMLGMSENEGIVKLMLADLSKGGYVSASRAGSSLTGKGQELLDQYLNAYSIVAIESINVESLGSGPINVGIHLKGGADKIQTGMEQRDVAVRAGATGASIFTFKDDVLGIPTVYRDFSIKHPNLADRIHRLFDFKDGDILLLVFAEDKWRALEGALAAAKSLA